MQTPGSSPAGTRRFCYPVFRVRGEWDSLSTASLMDNPLNAIDMAWTSRWLVLVHLTPALA